ncbi:MAG TPA: PAC2 family protein [Acidimicrobiales bacterium]|nr:PAC2 family protein [Acidimicrobiales bacterium]
MNPVLVVHLEGWIDAGLGGSTAMAALLEAGDVVPVAEFDTDELLDMRARRPTLRIADGVAQGLTWRDIRVLAAEDRAGNDILLLAGAEPDMRWRAFAGDVVALGRELGVRMMVALGAFPAPAPHTRPVRLAATASDEEMARRVGFVAGSIEVPAGISAVLEAEFAAAGVPSIGLWARVPHYVAGLPYPAAASALVSGLAEVAGLSLTTTDLDTAADVALRRVDELIANSAEHQSMVRQLEVSVDSTEGNPLDLGEVPTGDDIAAELERFLRGER